MGRKGWKCWRNLVVFFLLASLSLVVGEVNDPGLHAKVVVDIFSGNDNGIQDAGFRRPNPLLSLLWGPWWWSYKLN
jgi:hypothetical protein